MISRNFREINLFTYVQEDVTSWQTKIVIWFHEFSSNQCREWVKFFSIKNI